MNTSIADISDIRKSIQVTLDTTLLQSQEQKAIQYFEKNARIPGFRKGKAPASVIRNQFGKEILEHVNDNCISSALKHIEQSSKFQLYGLVDVQGQVTSIQEPQNLTFVVDLIPQFELPSYKEIEIQVPPPSVSPEEVDQFIERIRTERAKFLPSTNPAEKGDYVQLSYQAINQDGTPLSMDASIPSKYIAQTSTWEEVQGPKDVATLPSLPDSLLGAKRKDTLIIKESYPENCQTPPLAGQTITYKVSIEEINTLHKPELDEAFLTTLKVKSIQDLKEAIENTLKNQKENDTHNQKRAQILEFLDKNTQFSVPETAQDTEAQSLLEDYVRRQTARGASQKQIQENEETLIQHSRQAGNIRAKAQFILSRIAEQEKIEPTQEDMKQAILSECMAQRTTPDKFIKHIQKDKAHLNRFRRNVLLDKTLEFLVNNAKVTYTPII